MVKTDELYISGACRECEKFCRGDGGSQLAGEGRAGLNQNAINFVAFNFVVASSSHVHFV